MNHVPLLLRSLVFVLLCLQPSPLFAAQPPSPTEAQRDKVAATLRPVRPDGPRDAEVAVHAEDLLTREGEAIVPAIREALADADGPRRDVLDGALVRILWKRNPREEAAQWVAEATHLDDAAWRAEHAPVPISDRTVTATFPTYRFYTVHFRLYPVARLAPAPLKEQNLLAVSRTGGVTQLTSSDALGPFFKAHLAPVDGSRAVRDATYTWLRLSQEFSWDGFFQFTIPRDNLAVERDGGMRTGSGDAIVTPKGGDRGRIHVALSFNAAGKLAAVDETRSVQAGARPICQATRLLDKDPLVRAMAEQALMVMGISARDYLAERRSEAAPELRRAIDAIWARILERERAVGGTLLRTDLRAGP